MIFVGLACPRGHDLVMGLAGLAGLAGLVRFPLQALRLRYWGERVPVCPMWRTPMCTVEGGVDAERRGHRVEECVRSCARSAPSGWPRTSAILGIP